MSKRLFTFFLLLLTCFLAPSCKRNSCPLSSGSTVSEQRDLAPFSQIILYDKVNLILTQDSIQQVRVSAGKNLLPGVQTVVSEGVLTIRDNNTCMLRSLSDQTNIYISSDQLQRITYYGGGDVHSTNTLLSEVFAVDAWLGSGTIRLDVRAAEVFAQVHNENATIVLTGATDSAYVYCSEAGAADLSGMVSSAVRVYHTSIRDIYINATRAIYTAIAYKGNVYYKGTPSLIDQKNTGSGSLIYLP